MNNLDSVLQVYFVDSDVDSISQALRVSGATPEKGMSSSCFRDCFLKHNSMYGTDVIESIRAMSDDYWLSSKTTPGAKSVFNILSAASKELLEWYHDEPTCKYDEYLRWNELTKIVGEDLLTTAFLANQQVESGASEEPTSFAWKPYVITKNQNLNEILDKGLHELHFHLYGSSLGISINWLSLMNRIRKSFRKNLEKHNKRLLLNVLKARYIRYYLFKMVTDNQMSEDRKTRTVIEKVVRSKSVAEAYLAGQSLNLKIERELNNALKFGEKRVDYALQKPVSKLDFKRYYNLPLIGERKLLYRALYKIYSQDPKFESCKGLFYIYLLIKNQFRHLLIQNDEVKGFSYFQDIQSRKTDFIENDSIYASLFVNMAAQNTIGNQPIKYLEMRIAPQRKKDKLIEAIETNNKHICSSKFRFGERDVIEAKDAKLGYVLHFIKKFEKKTPSYSCRNNSCRKQIEVQANAIALMIRENSKFIKGGIDTHQKNDEFANPIKDDVKLYPIVGIDAASSEFNCRPEVFAPVYRYLKNIRRKSNLDNLYVRHDLDLGRTFHVGEDFYDVTDGLRAVDECIRFLNFDCGDRLGHAVALGINPYEYYKVRNFRVVMPKQVLLDNVVWLYKKMQQYSVQDKNGFVNRINNVFQMHFYDVYENIKNITIDDYYQSWMLRGDHPDYIRSKAIVTEKPHYKNSADSNLDYIRNKDHVCELAYAYYFDKDVFERGNRCVEFSFEDSDAFIIAEIQQKMREEIAKLKISIETNPTSNLRITDIERYSKHPITKFNNYGLVDNPTVEQIEVSINTDDQGVFATSLEKEFTLMAAALEKKRDSEGKPEYSPRKIYDWLDSVRRSAGRNSFLKDVN